VTTVARPRPDAAAKAPILDGLLGPVADRIVQDASGENALPGASLPAQPQKNRWPEILASGETELRALIRDPSVKPLDRQLRHAACRGMEPDVYHPDQGQPGQLALARCAGCQVRLACLALALRAEDPDMRSGWYGGLGPEDRDAIAAFLGLSKPETELVHDSAARAAQLRAAGWNAGAIATELGCSRRTVQRYLRKSAAGQVPDGISSGTSWSVSQARQPRAVCQRADVG
jgi:hypothetical protein